MSWSDETLMAFADGELDAAQSDLLRAAVQDDPAIHQRIDSLVLQRRRLGVAFSAVLDEPLPERLTQLLQTPLAASTPAPSFSKTSRSGSFGTALGQYWSLLAQRVWPGSNAGAWGAVAASVMLGVLLGTQWNSGTPTGTGLAMRDGRLLADGTVAQALASQLANAPLDNQRVSVQLSFVDQSGNYCRTFTTPALAGLACLESDGWAVQLLTTSDRSTAGEIRQAATALPPAILDAVDQRMVGSPFDVAGERAARARGWRR